MVDLRKTKRSPAKINENQNDGKYHIINGNLNLLSWDVLKPKNVITDKYNIALTKTGFNKPGKYWQKLINTDD